MRITEAERVGLSSDRLANINRKLSAYVEAGNVAGFLTLVARHGEVVHSEAIGYRDAGQRLPIELDTIFRIYSMTKPVTSVALMMLYERGKFQLTDPVGKYIPAFAKTRVLSGYGFLGKELVEQDPPMTVQHLLTHTAGLSYGFFYDTPIDEMYRDSIFRSRDGFPGRKDPGHGRIAAPAPTRYSLELQHRHGRLRLSVTSPGGYAF